MRLGNYEKAGEILHQVTQTNQAKLLDKWQTSQWYLWEGYLYYALLRTEGQKNVAQLAPRYATVQLPEFDAYTQLLAKDKQGYQIQVLILKTFLLREIDKTLLSHHTKRLYMYNQRHLTNAIDTKTSNFFRMIANAAAVDFDSAKTLKRVNTMNDTLTSPDHFLERQELIPYHRLWKMIKID